MVTEKQIIFINIVFISRLSIRRLLPYLIGAEVCECMTFARIAI